MRNQRRVWHPQTIILRSGRGRFVVSQEDEHPKKDGASDAGGSNGREKLVEGAATALGSIAILALAGFSYDGYYKSRILSKMENAFAEGYSSLELATLGRQHLDVSEEQIKASFAQAGWIERPEQQSVNKLVDGTSQGQYCLITGEKGTGKTTMLLHAMDMVKGDGIAMLEAHSDLEIFRLRLGKAVDYEFHEDYMGSLFSFKGPRDTTPLLDIERAFNKMEKVAMSRRQRTGKPLVLIIKSIHLVKDDSEGRDLIELLQQRAELWAASCLVTTILVSNDHWITERLNAEASRMRLLSIRDVPKVSATAALRSFRKKAFDEEVTDEALDEVYSTVGGRLRFLTQVATANSIKEACKAICAKEKRWLLNQVWILGGEMDDDAEENQNYCVAAMILIKALVELEQKMDKAEILNGRLPRVSLHMAREIQTRSDFIELQDHANIFTIDSESMVQADSVAMQRAFREIVQDEQFEKRLQATLERLDEIEFKQRTRELFMRKAQPSSS